MDFNGVIANIYDPVNQALRVSASGGAAPTDATYITGSANSTLSGEILMATVINRGTDAQRVASSPLGGWVWYTTDTGINYWYSGAAWFEFSRSVAALDTRYDAAGTAASAQSASQPLDSDLTAIAALSTTSFGRGLLASADAAALRTTAGLGTAAVADTGTGGANVPTITQTDARYQPLDSDLTAIAALSTTSYGRAFLALADAAAGRTALGLGTAATHATGDYDAVGAAAAAQSASQPLDSDLTAIAALTTTTFGRSLLAMADAAAVKTALSIVNTDVSGLGSLATLSAVGSAQITDGSILDADINSGAAIALSKLATDPLARANHTGTQLASTISDFDTQMRLLSRAPSASVTQTATTSSLVVGDLELANGNFYELAADAVLELT